MVDVGTLPSKKRKQASDQDAHHAFSASSSLGPIKTGRFHLFVVRIPSN